MILSDIFQLTLGYTKVRSFTKKNKSRHFLSKFVRQMLLFVMGNTVSVSARTHYREYDVLISVSACTHLSECAYSLS